MSDPFPEPKSNLPVSISGKRYGVPLKWEPRANMEEPRTVRNEKRNTPTRERKKTQRGGGCKI